MKMLRITIIAAILTFMLSLFNCSKNDISVPMPGNHYFPIKEGFWVEYHVDSIAYNSLQDTVIKYNYILRETIGSSFEDIAGNKWHRVYRQTKTDISGNFSPAGVVAHKISHQTAERIENNLRFIKLAFPFRINKQWNGNSYINYDDHFFCDFYGDWDYKYKELFQKKEINDIRIDSVVVVQHVADSGLICKNHIVEMYAPNIGLVYKKVERLTTQSTSSEPFYKRAEDGYIVEYSVLNWKK